MGTSSRKTAISSHGRRLSPARSIYGWHVISFLVGVLLTALLPMAFRPSSPDPAVQSAPLRVASAHLPEADAIGPWGRLRITPMVLERPDELFELDDGAVPPLRWSFPNHTAPELTAFLAACNLTEAQRAALLDTNRWQAGPTGWRIAPPPEVVRELSEPARARIYGVLAHSPDNPQRFPFFCREDQFEEMFEGCDLPSGKVALVRSLCYRKGGLLHFADGHLFQLLSTSNKTHSLFKTLLRVPTLLAKLHVAPDSDPAALAAYWDSGGRTKDLKPLFRSLARVPGGGTINLSYFLPPVPRLQLYTYPRPARGPHRDCFWTAFNFFGERPGYRLGDTKFTDQLLRSDYVRVEEGKRFGDVLLLSEGGYAVHACVYLAGDIHYTKNGNDPNQPWVLMTMKDMMTQYGSGYPQEWRVYRRKST